MPRVILALLLLLLVPLGASAQPQALPVEQLKKIKAATAFIKVRVGRLGGSGSGFVVHAAKEYGLVVTNEHVISPDLDDMDGAPAGAVPTIDVVFHSGQGASEWSSKAEVLYTNKADDLALLKVKAIKPIPEPLSLSGADKLPETTPVYVCGFPFGEFLAEGNKNPEISIGGASVSSNRADESGQVVTVQLNGAINPGNSGGPVVTVEGKLVGVAVRTLRGAGIGFAVPPHRVRRIVDEIHFTYPASTWVDGAPRKIRLVTKYLDVVGRMKTVTAVAAPGANAWKTANADDVSKQPKAKDYPATLDAAAGTVTVELPVPETSHFWLQFVWTDAAGKSDRGPPVWVASEQIPPDPFDPFEPSPRVRVVPPPPPRPTPKPPMPKADPPITGVVETNGTTLPPVATGLGQTPAGQIDAAELNDAARERINEPFTVDVLTSGVGPGKGDGPHLVAFDRDRQELKNLDFVLDSGLAEQLNSKRFRGRVFAVRLAGRIERSPTAQRWDLFVIKEIGVLGTDGRAVATYSGAGIHTPVPPKSTPPLRTVPPTAPPKIGSLEQQAEHYQRFQNFDPTVINQEFGFNVMYRGIQHRRGVRNASSAPAIDIQVLVPESLTAFNGMKFYVLAEQVDALTLHRQAFGAGPMPCRLDFKAVRIHREGTAPATIDCVVTNIAVPDRVVAGKTINLKGDEAQILATLPLPDQAVIVHPMPDAQRVGRPDAEESGSTVLTIALTAVVGLLVVGCLAWVLLRGRPPKKAVVDKTRRRTPTTRRKVERDDDEDDDEPRPRRRRS